MTGRLKQTGASQTLTTLQQLGVTDIFGYPGGAIMPMYDAIYQSSIKHYLCRHEQGAAFAAVGYARASGKVGVCMATSGPGATNLITGLADAMADSIPVVAITGQVPTRAMGSDGFQEVDIISLSLACTKHSFQIKDVNELSNCLQQAFKIASSGRPGPVLIDIPKDIQIAEIEGAVELNQSENTIEFVESEIAEKTPSTELKNDSVLQVEQKLSEQELNQKHRLFNQAVELIKAASQPILYVGGGVGIANAVDDLNQLIKLTRIPSISTLKGLGAVSPDEKYYLGMLGMHGSKAANFAIQQCDLMVVLGARFDDRATGKLVDFAPNAKVIHLDIDPAEINKRRHADVALIGNLNGSISQLIQALKNDHFELYSNTFEKWRSHCHQLREQSERSVQKEMEQTSKGILAPCLLKELSERLLHAVKKQHDNGSGLGQRLHVTTDVGQHQMWAAQHMTFAEPSQFISSSGLGTMGFGIPTAIGAQISNPDALVLCVSGDGSFMMNVQELGTIKRYQVPVKILLIDNEKLGLVRQWQQLFFEERYSETDLSDNPDFVGLAKAFDIQAEMISAKDQVSDAIERMLSYPGPYLLQVKIDAFENVWPLVPPDTANDKMMYQVADEAMD